ncbi:hypothetical protein BV898_10959 [Hypsibius exemplaris]|uniref:Uncharacterized protein n=1 Tax=Hypsibius exemplaris TaxID=2072580 RepID=A0A1W0WI01_HYPEX|nr:hypothetical protein BV898_10959 [Hypsibius exemplaris]
MMIQHFIRQLFRSWMRSFPVVDHPRLASVRQTDVERTYHAWTGRLVGHYFVEDGASIVRHCGIACHNLLVHDKTDSSPPYGCDYCLLICPSAADAIRDVIAGIGFMAAHLSGK